MQILKNEGSYLPLFWLIYRENLYMDKMLNTKFHFKENAANPLFVERERERERERANESLFPFST